MVKKSNKLNIHLIKEEFKEFEDIIVSNKKSFEIEGVGTFYMESSYIKKPAWIKNFFGITDDSLPLNVSNAKGVLLTCINYSGNERIFAITFGHGRFMLEKDVSEDRFGLKVVLNSVNSDSIRCIDKVEFGTIIKQSREQVSREGTFANFGIDVEQVLVKSVTGHSLSSYEKLGKTISGRNSLSITTKVDISNVVDLLKICLERYLSDDYKDNFSWIDNIIDIQNEELIVDLNNILVGKLQKKDLSKIWMAPPEIIDWVNVKGFQYKNKKKSELKPDINIIEFLDDLNHKEITFDFLKNTYIYLISSESENISYKWNAYKCLYAELEHNNSIYILNQGKWYEIANDFCKEVIKKFNETKHSTIDFPEYNHENEKEYNKYLPSKIEDSYCMDGKLIMHGGGHSKIEFCDILTGKKELIHIKRYSGASQLSHLFSQGVVAAETFVLDAEFRQKLNKILPPSQKLQDTKIRPDTGKYTVIFAIISKSQKSLDIPFFSKVNLSNARKRLEGYGYNVQIKKIKRCLTMKEASISS